MPDTRTLRDKLRDMAERGTPNEAAIAREKLRAMGDAPTPEARAFAERDAEDWVSRMYWDGGTLRVSDVRWDDVGSAVGAMLREYRATRSRKRLT